MQIIGVMAEQLFIDFVNSEWYDGRGNVEERLLSAEWRSQFVEAWGLGYQEAPSATKFESLVALRHVIRTLIEDVYGGREPSTARLIDFASGLGTVPMSLAIEGDPPGARWTAARSSWTYVEAEVIRSCLTLLNGPARLRLRRCENEGCRWAFVDASRNGCRRWCDPAICGNVSKVRAYRERRRAAS